jgi:trk system potassium uptake protein TrkA
MRPGRGALATLLDEAKHELPSLILIPTASAVCRRLSGERPSLATALTVNAQESRHEDADIFVALTQGDNRNVMACQIAKHIFNVPTRTVPHL